MSTRIPLPTHEHERMCTRGERTTVVQWGTKEELMLHEQTLENELKAVQKVVDVVPIAADVSFRSCRLCSSLPAIQSSKPISP